MLPAYNIDCRHPHPQHQAMEPMGSRLSDEEQARFNKLVVKAKELASQGHVKHALELNQRALTLHHSDKLAKRVAKMEVRILKVGLLLCTK